MSDFWIKNLNIFLLCYKTVCYETFCFSCLFSLKLLRKVRGKLGCFISVRWRKKSKFPLSFSWHLQWQGEDLFITTWSSSSPCGLHWHHRDLLQFWQDKSPYFSDTTLVALMGHLVIALWRWNSRLPTFVGMHAVEPQFLDSVWLE